MFPILLFSFLLNVAADQLAGNSANFTTLAHLQIVKIIQLQLITGFCFRSPDMEIEILGFYCLMIKKMFLILGPKGWAS